MSLSSLLKTISAPPTIKIKDVEIFFPPEYLFSDEQWQEAIFRYIDSTSGKTPVRLSISIQQFLAQRMPERKDWTTAVTFSNLRWDKNRALVDLEFEKDKGGLTVLVVYRAEQMSLIAVVPDFKNNNEIKHFSMSYVA